MKSTGVARRRPDPSAAIGAATFPPGTLKTAVTRQQPTASRQGINALDTLGTAPGFCGVDGRTTSHGNERPARVERMAMPVSAGAGGWLLALQSLQDAAAGLEPTA